MRLRGGGATLLRPDGTATYQLASVVDDLELEITHVLRGSDHRPNLELQRRIARAVGGELPEVIHHGLMLGPDGKKLSKRHGHASIADLREEGFPPEGVRAYLDELGLPAHDVQLDLPRLRRLATDAIAAMSDAELAAAAGAPIEAVPALSRSAFARRGSRVRTVRRRPPVEASLRPTRVRRSSASASSGRTAPISSPRTGPRSVVRELKAVGGDLRSLRLALTGAAKGPELWAVLAAVPRDEALERARRACLALSTIAGCACTTASRATSSSCRPRPGRSGCTSAARPCTSASTSATGDRSSSESGSGTGFGTRVTRSRSSTTSPTSTTRSTRGRHPGRSEPGALRSARRRGSSRTPMLSGWDDPTSSLVRPRRSRRSWSSSRSSWRSEKAYVADGDVYFSVAGFPDYGRLSGARLEDMVAQETSELKRGSARLRALEGTEAARGRGLGIALGARTPWLAHRVLCHGREDPRPRVRDPRWRERPSSSRTTRTSSRSPGAWAAPSPGSGCTTACSSSTPAKMSKSLGNVVDAAKRARRLGSGGAARVPSDRCLEQAGRLRRRRDAAGGGPS